MDIIMSGRTHDIFRQNSGGFATSRSHIGDPLPRDLRLSAFRPCIGHTVANAVPASQFERIASAAASISRQRVRLLGILLAAASPSPCGGPPVLRPIWATEAMHRAYSLIRLVARLEQNAPLRRNRPSNPFRYENVLGVELASIFDALTITRNEELRASSKPVRDIARNLVELFGPSAGHITLATSVERLILPAFQHRALVLMTSELIINCLLHAFGDRPSGHMTLQLYRLKNDMARLAVIDDGCGLFVSGPHHPARCSVINDLADLLQSEVLYRSASDGGTVAEIDIPLQG
jgi:hypothetical protein